HGKTGGGGGNAGTRRGSPRGDSGESHRTRVARPGAAAGSCGADSGGEHSQNIKRQVATGRDQAALSSGHAFSSTPSGVGADRAARREEIGRASCRERVWIA